MKLIRYSFSLHSSVNHFEFFQNIMNKADYWMNGLSDADKCLFNYWVLKSIEPTIDFGDISPSIFINDVYEYQLKDFTDTRSLMKVVESDFNLYMKTQPNLFVKNYIVQLLVEFHPISCDFSINDLYLQTYKPKYANEAE